MNRRLSRRLGAYLLVLSSSTRLVGADLSEFYIGVDGRSAPFTAAPADGGGTYPDNPNFGRLTFLFNHVDHFHGIGAVTYAGPAAAPTLLDTNGNNRIPETFTGQPPLALVPGSGAYAGKNVSTHIAGAEYSDLELRNVHSLGSVDDVLYNSSGNRWNGAFEAADVHLRLLSVSSPLLRVGSPTDPGALPVGGDVHLGEGNEMFSFTPVLWVDDSAPVGHYWGEFQLVDLSGTFGDSGRFYIDVRNVPEPGSALLILSGGLLAVCLARRRDQALRSN